MLIALKTEHLAWSMRQVIADAIGSGHLPDGVRLAHPTVHRLQVLHNGAEAGQATILDAYANASVKRVRPSRQIESDTPPAQPPPSPLALRKLDRRQEHD